MPHSQFLPRTWEPIPGALDTAMLAFERRPGVLHCNTYVLKTSEYALIIDPGADAAQSQDIARLVRELVQEMPRQVAICLTHCHLDHCSSAGAIAQACSPECIVVCHQAGADALRTHDVEASLQAITGLDFPALSDFHPLFSGSGLGSVSRAMDTPGGGLRSLSIPIGPRDALQAYHTPGHSPDSICFRVGGALFAGDLPFAAGPGFVQLPGWDAEQLATSIEKMLWLLDHCNITTVYAGHGRALDRTEARASFLRMLEHLPPLTAPKPGRDFPVAQLRACSDLLVKAASRTGLPTLDLCEPTDLSLGFGDDPASPALHAAASRAALHLDGLNAATIPPQDARLLLRARRRLGDFLCALHGFRFDLHAGAIELNYTIATLVAEASGQPDFASTSIGFAHALTSPVAIMDAEVLADLVETVLEHFAEAGADRAETAIIPHGDRTIVRVTHPGGATAIPERLGEYLRLSMEAYGGEFADAPGLCDFIMRLPEETAKETVS